MSYPVYVRNNLDIPVRIIIHASNKLEGRIEPEIQITIETDKAPTSMRGICIESDVKPDVWKEIGVLEVFMEPKIKVAGKDTVT